MHSVLPFNATDSVQAVLVELLQLLDVAMIQSPFFTAVQECTQDYCPIHCYLHLQLDPSFLPGCLCEHAKGTAGFCNVLGNFGIQGSIVAEGTAEKAELFHSLDLCAIDDNRWGLWCIWGLGWCWLVHGLSLADANCKIETSAGR